MTTAENGKPKALWHFFDLVLEACAITHDFDTEVSGFALLAALAVGNHLGLRSIIIYHMRDSAVAEVRRKRRGGEPRSGDPGR